MHLADPVGRVYAEALYGIALDRSTVDETLGELEGFVALVRESPDIRRFLTTPVLEPSVKIGHLRPAFEGRVSDPVADFLCLLVDKGRIAALGKILSAFRDMADEHANRARVSVRTATALSEGLRTELESTLRSKLSKEIVVESEVEPGIMGGAVITVDDKVWDGSVKNRLGQFRKQIMRSGGYEAQG